MANRMAVLAITESLFKDWQIVIFTYHKAWFEILRARTADGRWIFPWRAVSLRARRALGLELTIVASESGTLLQQAKSHQEMGDFKAAAVYARSAWEATLGWYCAEWRLPVRHMTARRGLDTEDFLRAISEHLRELADPVTSLEAVGVLAEIRHARRFVLNPNAHYDPELEDEIGAEVGATIQAVEDFEDFV